jgi:hypothetical protein
MNNKITAITALVLGIGVFVAGLAVSSSPPILRSTEDSKIAAVCSASDSNSVCYDAPMVQVKTTNDVITLAEVTITNRQTATGKAHARRSDADSEDLAQSSAEGSGSVVSPSNGLFSTAGALDYNPARYHNRVPNVQYVKPTCKLCTK